jgi:hypothetical protein
MMRKETTDPFSKEAIASLEYWKLRAGGRRAV